MSYNTSGIGYNWSIWNHATNPDTTYDWGWTFNFPNGTGFYEFYSIGMDLYIPENAKNSAEVLCKRIP